MKLIKIIKCTQSLLVLILLFTFIILQKKKFMNEYIWNYNIIYFLKYFLFENILK
jgi:hypothetical protein